MKSDQLCSRFTLFFLSMPLTTEFIQRVAYHECDPQLIVRDSSYLRYMQEAAFIASAAAGYWQDRLVAMRRVWLIREHQVDFLSPLRYGDQVRVITWVADFRRVRSRRAYEIRGRGIPGYTNEQTGDERLVARAFTDWVFLDLDTGRPAVIPDEVGRAYLPEGAAGAAAQERERFPLLVAPPDAFRKRTCVQWRDLDSVGHVNNATYGDYIENAARQALAIRGWSPARCTAAGFDLTTQQLRIEYRQPALFNDILEISTWLAEVGPNAMMRHTTLRRVEDDELLVQASARWGCVDSVARRPSALPPALVADLA